MTLAAGQLLFIVGALAAAAAVSFALTPLASRIAARLGAIDQPDSGRRVHRAPVPRGGGMAVAASFIGVGLTALWLANVADVFAGYPRFVALTRVENPELLGLFGGVALAAVMGFVDDRWQLRARWQLLDQLILAAVVIASGITISVVVNPLDFLGGIFETPTGVIRFEPAIAAVVTALWIVGMINSINFIDGLDGLSTGVSLIAALTLGVLSLLGTQFQVQPDVALLCALLAGALAGFLPWNFHPARVFIGTTGVFAVGFALAVLSILGTAKVAVALLVLGVPIIDTFWIIIRRLSAGRSPFTPDRGHLHHRLLDLGLTHRGAVLLIYALCVLLALLSVILSPTVRLADGASQIYAFTGLVVVGGLVLYRLTRRAQDALDARSYPDEAARGSAGVDSDTDQPPARPPSGASRDESHAHGTGPAR